MKKSKIFLFFILLLFISFSVLYNTLDPDFGWHLRTGQLILERGVPYQDWYSYTMPNFSWINHEWLTDILIYKIYSYFGLRFLLFSFIFIYTIAFFIAKKPSQSFWSFFLPVTLGYVGTIGFLGIRPQLITVLFIAVLYNIVNKFLENNSKIIYILPFLFILWVNMHAGFFAGLFILFTILALEILKRSGISEKISVFHFLNNFNFKKQPFSKILVLGAVIIFSFFATMINPYGLRIYEEIFRTVGDNFLKFHITEWQPLFFIWPNLFLVIYIGLFISLLIIFYKRIALNDIIISVILLFLSLWSARYILIFVIITIPILSEAILYLKEKINILQGYHSLAQFDKFALMLFSVFLLTLLGFNLYQILGTTLDSYVYNFYPEKAIPFLETLPLSENLFNYYDWGGYLIWRLPERKVFIDGRMPSWRQDGQFIFGDYIRIANTEDGFEKILNTYDVDFAVLQNINSIKSGDNLPNSAVGNFFIKHPSLAKFLGLAQSKNLSEELKNIGWKTIYQDEVAIILKKN